MNNTEFSISQDGDLSTTSGDSTRLAFTAQHVSGSCTTDAILRSGEFDGAYRISGEFSSNFNGFYLADAYFSCSNSKLKYPAKYSLVIHVVNLQNLFRARGRGSAKSEFVF